MDKRIKCQCRLQVKTGVACSHAIKVLLCLGKSLKEGINDRWIIDEARLE